MIALAVITRNRGSAWEGRDEGGRRKGARVHTSGLRRLGDTMMMMVWMDRARPAAHGARRDGARQSIRRW